MGFTTILDRYILVRLWQTYVLGLFAFFGLYVFIDLIGRIYKFQNVAGETDFPRMFRYYLYSLPDLFLIFGGIIFSLAAVIVLVRLAKSSQIVAALSGGISIFRLIRPFQFSAILLGLIHFWCQEEIVPEFKRALITIKEPDFFTRTSQISATFKDRIIVAENFFHESHALKFERANAMIDLERIDYDKRKVIGFHAMIFDERQRPKLKIYASSAQWVTDTKVELNNGFIHPYTSFDEFPDSLKDRIFEEPKHIELTIPFGAALYSRLDKQALSLKELEFFIPAFTRDAGLYAEYIKRFFAPFYPFLTLMISLSLSLVILSRSPTWGIVISLLSSVAFNQATYVLENELKEQRLTYDLMAIAYLSMLFLFYSIGRLMTKS